MKQYKLCNDIWFPNILNIFKNYDFQGFSDHTLGYHQTLEAIKNGAEYIEKHITLDHKDINCPDNNFALKPKELNINNIFKVTAFSAQKFQSSEKWSKYP